MSGMPVALAARAIKASYMQEKGFSLTAAKSGLKCFASVEIYEIVVQCS